MPPREGPLSERRLGWGVGFRSAAIFRLDSGLPNAACVTLHTRMRLGAGADARPSSPARVNRLPLAWLELCGLYIWPYGRGMMLGTSTAPSYHYPHSSRRASAGGGAG